ncbi:MAG TPA: OB-fold domain-containing protein [Steroidobacteraceae bacterium]|nr:OB-fold domain-containing protein [Steroidobacteraceae bacterium]
MSGNEAEGSPAPIRPDPVFTADAAFFWEGAARGELLGQRCADCKRFAHPPRPMCPHCHSVRREIVKLSGRGAVCSWITPRHPPPVGFTEAPIVALIDLEEGIRLVSNLVEMAPESVRAGLAVEVRFAPTRGGRAVPVFRPRGAARE